MRGSKCGEIVTDKGCRTKSIERPMPGNKGLIYIIKYLTETSE